MLVCISSSRWRSNRNNTLDVSSYLACVPRFPTASIVPFIENQDPNTRQSASSNKRSYSQANITAHAELGSLCAHLLPMWSAVSVHVLQRAIPVDRRYTLCCTSSLYLCCDVPNPKLLLVPGVAPLPCVHSYQISYRVARGGELAETSVYLGRIKAYHVLMRPDSQYRIISLHAMTCSRSNVTGTWSRRICAHRAHRSVYYWIYLKSQSSVGLVKPHWRIFFIFSRE